MIFQLDEETVANVVNEDGKLKTMIFNRYQPSWSGEMYFVGNLKHYAIASVTVDWFLLHFERVLR